MRTPHILPVLASALVVIGVAAYASADPAPKAPPPHTSGKGVASVAAPRDSKSSSSSSSVPKSPKTPSSSSSSSEAPQPK